MNGSGMVTIYIPKKQQEEWKKIAEYVKGTGMSMAGYIIALAQADMNKEAKAS